MPRIRRPSDVPVADEGGVVRQVPLTEWRVFHLPEALRISWVEPNDLARVIECAIEAGAHADVLGAAEQLSRVDPDRDRRYCLPAVVFARNGQFRRAEELLERRAELYGESPYALYAHAEVALSGNRRAKGHELLFRSLQLDPDASLPLRRLVEDLSRDGTDAVGAAVRELAATPGGWRAKLWLAANAASDAKDAESLVRDAVARTGDEPRVLAAASAVLARRDLTAALVDLVAARYRLEHDRLECGVNVLYGFLATGSKLPAEALLTSLAPRLEAAGLEGYAAFYRAAFRNLRGEAVEKEAIEPEIDLLRAMAAAARQDTRKARMHCWNLLGGATLLVPVRHAWIDVPIFDSPWPAMLPRLELVAGVDSEGREVAIAFTDQRARQAWGTASSPCVAMATRALLEIVSKEKGCSLLVNPAGPTATELALPDIEAFLDGRAPAGEESRTRFLAEPPRVKIPAGFLDSLSSFLRMSGIVREAWLFEMVDDRSGVNPTVAIGFEIDADPTEARELLIDGPEEVKWGSRRSRRVRFIPLDDGRLADYLRAVGVRVPL